MESDKPAKRLYEFGPFCVDAGERVLLRAGQPLALAPKLFETLLMLVKNSGHIVEKSDLMEAVWPETFVEESNLAANVSLLRKLLGTDAEGKPYIETVPRRGYRFAAEVTELQAGDAALLLRRRTRTRIIATEEEYAPRALLAGADDAPANGRFRVLAVLPFKTIGMEQSEEYLGLGLADALITQLSSTGKLIVRPTSAVLKYVATEQDSLAAGRELGADAVLEGSAQSAGQRLRVTVRMLAVKEERPLWADHFNAEMTDIFAAQDAIAEQVVAALELKLSGAERRRLTAHDTHDIAAYHAYLRGRYHLHKYSPDNLQRAIAHFREALAADSSYAQAYAGLAEAYVTLSYLQLPPQATLPQAKKAAEKAVELNDSLAEAHTALAVVKMLHDWDWAGSEQAYRHAIALNPYYAPARRLYGMFLATMKRFDEATAEFARALEIDPLSLPINAYLGSVLYAARRYDQAIEQCLKTLELDPSFLPALGFLGLSYAQKGNSAAAIQALEKQRQLDGSPLILSQLAYAYSVAGRKSDARRLLAGLRERAKTDYVSPAYIAMTYAALEDKDRAFAWLQKACDDRAILLPTLLSTEPRLDHLRADPRFAELLRRVGLSS